MLRRVYTFVSTHSRASITDSSASETASRAVAATINGQSGIQCYELTAPDNPKPVFAVLFAGEQQKEQFERLLGPTLALRGLRVNLVHSPDVSESAEQFGTSDFVLDPAPCA